MDMPNEVGKSRFLLRLSLRFEKKVRLLKIILS